MTSKERGKERMHQLPWSFRQPPFPRSCWTCFASSVSNLFELNHFADLRKQSASMDVSIIQVIIMLHALLGALGSVTLTQLFARNAL